MKLRDIYEKNIERPINPAVVIGDREAATIQAEIDEYIFTDGIIENLYLLLQTVLTKTQGKTGIWINGYYGSGKSHFIKFTHYLLNPKYSEKAFEKFLNAVSKYDGSQPGKNEDITESNVKLLQKNINKAGVDNIIFNVEEETDDQQEKERFTRIILNMFNKFRGYNSNNIPLAILLEKELDKRGKFDTFKELVYQKMKMNWEKEVSVLARLHLKNMVDIAGTLIPDLDTTALYAHLSNPANYPITIQETLIPELKDYLKDKDRNYRLLFLIDEVSQYIGTNREILLNFQSIIERVSTDLNNQVWIAATAQQTLDDVSIGVDGVANVEDEFGKILGRFDTRISLQSNDAAFITQKRVLDKNSQGIKYTSELYHANRDYIENQFKINHDLFKGYQSEDDFVNAYPFVPYQFRLIAHVFEAFQQLQFVIKEVKDNERSVLGITHYTARNTADQEVGGFIPFDAFFNQQFNNNLTHRGERAIQNAKELTYVKNNPFAKRVVNVLFMISNLLEKQRQTFPSTIENISVLMMDTLDQNKRELQNKVREVLEKLIEESIIREERDSYFFFNEDEIDVQNLIKNQVLVLDDRLTTFDEFFRPLTRISSKVSFGQNDFKMAYSIEGREFYRNGEFELMVLIADRTPVAHKALDVNKKDLVVCINEWFLEDENLRKDFDLYVKTNKYLSNNSGGATGERDRTIENFKIRNNELRQRIENRIREHFSSTRFISQNQVVESDEINGSTPHDRIKNLIDFHLSGIYRNHTLSENYAQNQAQLRTSAADKQVPLPTLSTAEQVVNDYITANGNQITVYDLINEYEKEPFGWRFEAVLDVLIQLVKKKKREFVYKGQQPYPIVDFINKAVLNAERMSCQIVSGEEIDQAVLDEVVQSFNYVFNENLKPATDKNILFEDLVAELNKKLKHHEQLEQAYYGKYAFGNVFKKGSGKLLEWLGIRDIKRLFETFTGEKEEAKELFDLTKGIEDFANRTVREYDQIKQFMLENNENFKGMMKPEVLEKAKTINALFSEEDPRREFRHVKKAYEELKKELKDYTEELKEEVIRVYAEAFADLEKEAEQRDVEPQAYADREYTLVSIRKIQAIATLQNKKLSVSHFKKEQLEKIIEATPSGSKAAEPYNTRKGYTTISNEEELEAYLEKLRKDMLALLKQQKTIILE